MASRSVWTNRGSSGRRFRPAPARHRRIQLRFTPIGSSWLNQVETWFSILSQRATRRGAFTNVRALTEAIQRFLDHWNDDCNPFVSVKTADEILATLHRQRSHETVHRCTQPQWLRSLECQEPSDRRSDGYRPLHLIGRW
jgi:hypothetical protein